MLEIIGNIWQIAGAGAIGGLMKNIIEDGTLQMPEILKGKLSLGFFTSVLIGTVVGIVADGNILEAGMAGFVGFSVIANLLPTPACSTNNQPETVSATITRVCITNTVDPNLALKVANCESGLNPKAVNTNTDGSTDRGIFQINNKYHPEVTDAEAFDPEFSTQFFCTAFKAGNLSWWDSSKTCWGA